MIVHGFRLLEIGIGKLNGNAIHYIFVHFIVPLWLSDLGSLTTKDTEVYTENTKENQAMLINGFPLCLKLLTSYNRTTVELNIV